MIALGRLADRDLLGQGGEGRVYRLGDRAVKVFNTPSPARAAKLLAFPHQLPAAVIGPLDLCEDASGTVVGYVMRALDHAVDIHRLAQRTWREGRLGNADVLRIFRTLAETLERIHARGIVIGDLNDGNVVLTDKPWTPWLIDADSMQFGAHPCVVAHERFLDPRLYGVDLAQTHALSPASDWYALATMLFSSLLYIHPFGGAHPRYPTMLRRAEARCSVLRSDVKRPSAASPIETLPDDALAWFERVFEKDLREPIPRALLEARFVRCSCGTEHARATCPACRVRVAPSVRTRGSVRCTNTMRTRGRIVAAAMQGTLRWATIEDGMLVREEGTVVLRVDEPLELVRLAGNRTWVGTGGVVRCGDARYPVERVHGELAADAGLAGLVCVHGDTLMHAERATRTGQVLEGQTHVRTGDQLGFAFYRASTMTVAFVFDPRRGPLRQIERFPQIEGKLLGFHCDFSEDSVLVTFSTENGSVAHLVSARGEILATDKHGGAAAVLGKNVLRATDDGLVLLRAESGSLVPVRSFPETRDFVPPDAELIAGPGGSLYVVTHDEISHLMFY